MKNDILVTRSSMPPYEEYIQEIESLWESHWLTNMGAKHQQLQKELKTYLNVDNIELLVNGHMALEMTLQAMNLQGEVITTPFTFASTTHAIVRNGLRPIFCDIKADDYTIDVEKIEERITDATVAILPVHVYGNVCDIDCIDKISKKYGLKVIYDAAHAFGETFRGEGIGNFGDASCFSFHATKVFNTIEGGAVCYKDKELGRKIYELKNFGIHGLEKVCAVGANAKMNEFCAAMGICNLRHIESEIEKRQQVYERYLYNLRNVTGIYIGEIDKELKRNYAYFPILIDEEEYGATRDELYEYLGTFGIGTRKYFYPLTSQCEAFQGLYDVRETPVAYNISKRILTLPMYSDLELDQVDMISKLIIDMKR